MPTAQRAPAALLVRRGGDKLLFDCAEGTQRQLLRSSVGLLELEEIFVTHFHADPVLGPPGRGAAAPHLWPARPRRPARVAEARRRQAELRAAARRGRAWRRARPRR